MSWHERAACVGADPALFDPLRVEGNDARDRRVTRAFEICAGCTVADACLREARRHQDSGIRGGVLLDAGQPIVVVRQQKGRPASKPHGTHAAYIRHIRAGTQPCQPCKTAHAAYGAELRTGAA